MIFSKEKRKEENTSPGIREKLEGILRRDRIELDTAERARLHGSGCVLDSLKSLFVQTTGNAIPAEFLREFNTIFPDLSPTFEDFDKLDELMKRYLGLRFSDFYISQNWKEIEEDLNLDIQKGIVEFGKIYELLDQLQEEKKNVIVYLHSDLVLKDGVVGHAITILADDEEKLGKRELTQYLESDEKAKFQWELVAIAIVEGKNYE